jgi:hypothetical protein
VHAVCRVMGGSGDVPLGDPFSVGTAEACKLTATTRLLAITLPKYASQGRDREVLEGRPESSHDPTGSDWEWESDSEAVDPGK